MFQVRKIQPGRRLDDKVLQNKDNCQDIHERSHFLALSADNVKECIRNDSEADALRDGVHESHGCHADEGRNGLEQAVPSDLSYRLHHQITDHDQCRRSGKGRNREEQG